MTYSKNKELFLEKSCLKRITIVNFTFACFNDCKNQDKIIIFKTFFKNVGPLL